MSRKKSPKATTLHVIKSPKTPVYKSRFEETLAEQLRRLKSGARYEPYKLSYQLNLKYTPDWVLPNGVILEGKGKLDYETRRKMLAVKLANPGLKICFIFMRAKNKIRKGSDTTYGDWAEQNGFLWSDGEIKKEWLK